MSRPGFPVIHPIGFGRLKAAIIVTTQPGGWPEKKDGWGMHIPHPSFFSESSSLSLSSYL